jgi:hypothetical protein
MSTYQEEREFSKLVTEISSRRFTNSAQVSKYIMENRLGYKYKNISGIVTMRQGGRKWDFKGGFPSHIYARLCDELDLSNNGSKAEVVGFRSFRSV